MTTRPSPHFTATRNACKACTPLGACLAFRGVEGAVPFLHGSQGCSTYIRRYMIGHFREPVDIASSNFSEMAAVFGGMEHFLVGLRNVIDSYDPRLVGVATTCLAETIGDDMNLLMHRFRNEHPDVSVPVVCVSTPSFKGTHADGYHAAIRAIVETLAEGGTRRDGQVNLIPGMFSPEDLRHLLEIAADLGLTAVLLPDYSETLDGGSWSEYRRIPEGGTPVDAIRSMGASVATVEMTGTYDPERTAGRFLEREFGVPRRIIDWPVGIEASDRMFDELTGIRGRGLPDKYRRQRERLIDAYIDGHKYLSGVTAALYGEEDLVVSIARLCREIGIHPILCASGGESGKLASALEAIDGPGETEVLAGGDFAEIEQAVERRKPDLLIGHSKGVAISRKTGIPLVRVGFPVHDRIGAARIAHIGYAGTQRLFDRIVNTVIERRQVSSPHGYMNY